MSREPFRRYAGILLGCLIAGSLTLVIHQAAIAQRQKVAPVAADVVEPGVEMAQVMPPGEHSPPPPGVPPQPQIRFQVEPGGLPLPFPPAWGGGPAITANATTVYILRGNTVYALEGRTLRVLAQTELPPPAGGRPFGPGPRPAQPGAPGAPAHPPHGPEAPP
ncbi:MAG: hypothetical protein HY320_02690 [Armatimonadetes bacterium]|nr:hypothetical protein [Armatimonadota bacterium]